MLEESFYELAFCEFCGLEGDYELPYYFTCIHCGEVNIEVDNIPNSTPPEHQYRKKEDPDIEINPDLDDIPF